MPGKYQPTVQFECVLPRSIEELEQLFGQGLCGIRLPCDRLADDIQDGICELMSCHNLPPEVLESPLTPEDYHTGGNWEVRPFWSVPRGRPDPNGKRPGTGLLNLSCPPPGGRINPIERDGDLFVIQACDKRYWAGLGWVNDWRYAYQFGEGDDAWKESAAMAGSVCQLLEVACFPSCIPARSPRDGASLEPAWYVRRDPAAPKGSPPRCAHANYPELGPLADLLLDLADHIIDSGREKKAPRLAPAWTGQASHAAHFSLPDGRTIHFFGGSLAWLISDGVAKLCVDPSALAGLRKPGPARDAFLVLINDYKGPLPSEVLDALGRQQRRAGS